MINLPRQLIYQDRHVLEDYTAGNELNQALYDALRSIKHPSLIQRWKGVPALSDDDILRIFNDAYYLCIVMANDECCIPHDALCARVSSEYALQVARVILSLQDCITSKIGPYLYDDNGREPDMIACLSDVYSRFMTEECFFEMNFAIRPPEVASIELNWEVVTRGFKKEIIEGIINLWETTDDKLEICRKICSSFRNSPRQYMPYMPVNRNYFEDTVVKVLQQGWGKKESMECLWDWEDELLEEYYQEVEMKKEETATKNKEPEEDEKNDAEESFPVVKTESKGKSIFVDVLNNEDFSRRREETSRFMLFIRKQQWGDTVLDCKQDNVVCLAFVAFCREWHTKGWVLEKPNRGGCYRFLCDDCGFKLAVNERTFQTHIAKMLTHEYEIEDKLKEITPLVAAMF